MKLWLISQDENRDYDTYDSAVVAAESEDAARKIHPRDPNYDWEEKHFYSDWASKPENVSVKYIGEAAPGTEAGPICASFNAG